MSVAQKLTAVQLLEQLKTYEYDGQNEKSFKLFQNVYKEHAQKLQQLTTTGTARQVANWRRDFRKSNDLWSATMGEVEHTPYIGVINGKRSTYSEVTDTPLNNLRWFVTNATQECDKQVKDMETLRRNQERAAAAASEAALGNAPAEALLAMRACLDARETLF